MKKARKLRFHIFLPLFLVFALLWGALALQTRSGSRQEEERQQQLQAGALEREVLEQWSFYRNNQKRGLGEKAAHILSYNLSASGSWTPGMNAVFAAGVRDGEGRTLVSQIAMGYGHEAGVDQGQRWTLYFDGTLDDRGQLDLAQWLSAHREPRNWEYVLWPPESAGYAAAGETRVLRAVVTGRERPGCALDVERLVLTDPEGNEEVMVDTGPLSPGAVTKEFRYLKVHSLLQQGRTADPGAAERQLALYREAVAALPAGVGGQSQYGYHLFDPAADREGGPGYQVEYRADIEDHVNRETAPRLLTYGLLILGAALVLSVNLAHKIGEPVEQLCRQVREGRCTENGPIREINTLAASFNEGKEKLRVQLERERDFTRAAAHELKTPLAVLRTHAEALQEDVDPAKREHYLRVVVEETDRMSGLVGSLLELSRLESGAALNRETAEVSALIREVFAPLQLPLERKGMTLTLELEEARLFCDRQKLREAAGNLAANALRYGKPGGAVRVKLEHRGEFLRLRVENDCDPIPEEALPRLFEPFYRVDRARSRADGGTGLGLAIVKAAVESHGGSCRAEQIPGGLAVTLLFPGNT